MSRKRPPAKPRGVNPPIRAAGPAGREAVAQRVALVFVIITVAMVIGDVILKTGQFRWLAAGTALIAVAASLVHFIERGRRSMILEAAFRRGTEHLGEGEEPRQVKVRRADAVVPAVLGSDEGQWYLEAAGERIPYHLEDQGAMSAWPDYRLADFASQLSRKHRLTLRCCATCSHFGHSRVSRMASRGWVGYCTVSGEGLLLPERDGVHIWHLCSKWELKRL